MFLFFKKEPLLNEPLECWVTSTNRPKALTFQHLYIFHNKGYGNTIIFRRERDSAPQSSTQNLQLGILFLTFYKQYIFTLFPSLNPKFHHQNLPFDFPSLWSCDMSSSIFNPNYITGDPLYQSNSGNSVFCFSLPCTGISVKRFTNFNWDFSFFLSFFFLC